MPAYRAIEERLEKYTMPEPNSGCWLWLGELNESGYGRVSYKSKSHLAHRVSKEMEYGPLPDGVKVLHRCDMPSCINPDHLFLGTQQDNVDDMISKGRAAVHSGRLSATDKLEIKASYVKGQKPTLKELAVRYGVTDAAIYKVLSKRVSE